MECVCVCVGGGGGGGWAQTTEGNLAEYTSVTRRRATGGAGFKNYLVVFYSVLF